MNTRAFTLALIISIFAMFMVYTYIEDRENVLVEKYGKPVTVVVAKVNIKELELIDDSKVTVKSVPQTFAAPGHFRKVKDLEDGMIATVPILKGEQITKPRVSFPGFKTGLARTVSAGKRAIAITITEKQAVSKLLKPGDRVDVLAAIDYSAGRKDMQKVMTILQDVLVLSTGMNMTNSIPLIGIKTPKVIRKMNLSTYSQYNTVTMELDPYQVQKLVFLLTFTGIPPYLSLRNSSDNKVVRIKSTRIFDLLGEDASEAKAFFSDKYSKKGAR
jgi:pilus assembly protein CpaB